MNPKLERIVARIHEVPSLPSVLTDVLSTIDSPESTIDEIAREIKKDQSLTVNVLKIANSAFYGLLGTVSTIRQAIVIIGLNELRTIVLGQSVFRFYAVESRTDFKRKDLWTHSMVCAFLAKKLAKEAFLADREGSCMIGGLIHDIGKVVIDRYFPDEFVRIIRMVRNDGVSFAKAEREVLGYTHYQIGATLLKKWNFPPELVNCVLYHHAPWRDKEFPHISATVFHANVLAKVMKFPSYDKDKTHGSTWLKVPEQRRFLEKNGLPVQKRDLKTFLNSAYSRIISETSNVVGAMDLPSDTPSEQQAYAF